MLIESQNGIQWFQALIDSFQKMKEVGKLWGSGSMTNSHKEPPAALCYVLQGLLL